MKSSTKFFALLLVLLFVASSTALVACNDADAPSIDYSVTNSYDVDTLDTSASLAFTPNGVTPTYGLIFYVGTVISPEFYTYLGTALARQGYLVVIPKVGSLNMTYMEYQPTEAAFSTYPDVRFFIGGHSQGGGAAVRRAQENVDKTQGLVLLAPLTYSQEVTDSQGNVVSVPDSVKDTSLPSLLISASEDHVLTDEMKADSYTRLPVGFTHKTIEGGCHMSFSTCDDDGTLSAFGDGPLVGITKDQQRSTTVQYVLDFLSYTTTR